MSECKKTRKLCKELEKLNAVVVPYVGSTRQPDGYPDRIIWHSRWHGWLEFKDTTTKIKPIQKIRVRALNASVHGSAFIIRFPDRIQNWEGNDITTFDDAKDLLWKLKCLKSMPLEHWFLGPHAVESLIRESS